MTQIFDTDGRVVPITVIQTGPCYVLQIKSRESDGYGAVQLGFEDKKEARTKKPLLGQCRKAQVTPKKIVREVRVQNPQDYKLGQQIEPDIFSIGEFVDVIGTSRGMGFQGGVKRWHWKGGPATHGSMSHRAPGSIGASSYPSRVLKGQHMAGHMGHQRVTVQNLEVISMDKENNLFTVKGSVPGHKNSYLLIRKSKKNKVKAVKKDDTKAKEKKDKKTSGSKK